MIELAYLLMASSNASETLKRYITFSNHTNYCTNSSKIIYHYDVIQLKARYGGAYIFTVTTSPEQESEVDQLVRRLSTSAKKIYNLSGTQKFELPKQDVRIADVFSAVEIAKSRFRIHAWGLVDTTLEDVFIKVAKGAEVFNDVA